MVCNYIKINIYWSILLVHHKFLTVNVLARVCLVLLVCLATQTYTAVWISWLCYYKCHLDLLVFNTSFVLTQVVIYNAIGLCYIRVSSRDDTYLFIVKQSQHPNIPFIRQWIQTVNQTLWVGTWVQWQVGIMVCDHGNIGTIYPEILEVLKLGGLAPNKYKRYWQNLNLAVVAHSVYIILIIAHVYIRKRSRSLTWSTWRKPWVCKFTRNITGSVLAPSQLYLQLT